MFTSKNLLMYIGRNALISLGVILVTILIIFFIKREIESVTDNIVFNNKLETELKKRTELLSVIKHDAQIVGNNDVLISNAFLPSDNISTFINALDNLASSNGVSQSYRFETPVSLAASEAFPLSTIAYSNSLTTSVRNFSSYLKKFESMPYFTKIEGLNISSQDKSGWTGTCSISYKATLITEKSQ